MKIILFAYTQSVFYGRKIEALLQDSVHMMWLAQDYQPSYNGKVQEYDHRIAASKDVAERKQLRSACKTPKQSKKQFINFVTRKLKYQNSMKIFGKETAIPRPIMMPHLYA